MASGISKSTEIEYEQVVQQHDLMIKTAESSQDKCSNRKSPVVVFAPGSSAPSTSAWMFRWRNLLNTALNAVEVITFDYPNIYGGRKVAPNLGSLIEFYSEFVRKVATKYPEHPLILVGKSIGSRISCIVAAQNDIEASAVVCLGYPLKTAQQAVLTALSRRTRGKEPNAVIWHTNVYYNVALKGAIQDEPLLQLTVPIMFVQGGNDAFCPLKLLEVVMSKLQASNALHVIEHGDHSFQISKKNLELTGMTREKAEQYAAEAVAEFVSQVTSGTVINGPRNATCLSVRACPEGILPQHVLRTEACAADAKQKSQRVKSMAKKKKINTAKQKQPNKNARKRKSERIIKNKLRKCVYVKDGRGSTVDNPLDID